MIRTPDNRKLKNPKHQSPNSYMDPEFKAPFRRALNIKPEIPKLSDFQAVPDGMFLTMFFHLYDRLPVSTMAFLKNSLLWVQGA